MRTGDIIEAFHRKYLTGEELSQWAEQLLIDGTDSKELSLAAASPDMHWQDVPRYFRIICRQIGLSADIENDIEAVKERVMIEEYRSGQRPGAELLHRFERLRQAIRFPEGIIMKLIPDAPDGTNASGYYSDSGLTGTHLEDKIRKCFINAGITTA